MATKYRVVLVTVSNTAEARRIARKLVERELAACVNIIPKIGSVYRWEDVVEEAQETLLIIKSEKKLVEKIKKRVKRMHSYEVPEILVFKVDDGDENYLKWLSSEVR